MSDIFICTFWVHLSLFLCDKFPKWHCRVQVYLLVRVLDIQPLTSLQKPADGTSSLLLCVGHRHRLRSLKDSAWMASLWCWIWGTL